MENQLFYHPLSGQFRAQEAVPQSSNSNVPQRPPLATGRPHMQLQMEQQSMDPFRLAANLIQLELCQQVERLLTTSPSIVHQCYRDPHAVLETVRQTCRMAIADLRVPLPLPAQVSDTHPVITHDIEGTSSTVDNNSEIMRRMWRKFQAVEWVGKAHIPILPNSQSGIERYQCFIELLHEMERSIQRADFITFAGTYSMIADPKIDNKERVSLVSTDIFKKLDVRRSQSLPYFEQNNALRRYVMLSSCALETTGTQAHTGWIRLLAEDDLSHRMGIAGQRIEITVVRGGFEMIEKFECRLR
ncbi:hypothetical protein B0H14DRAFT_3032704 [Mycena olivaceomarginata]|nr:hypothetical protein B0H14DRAFT_3032704 [Mycena olivaceomarginata]